MNDSLREKNESLQESNAGLLVENKTLSKEIDTLRKEMKTLLDEKKNLNLGILFNYIAEVGFDNSWFFLIGIRVIIDSRGSSEN
jgi:cell division protein FtsB